MCSPKNLIQLVAYSTAESAFQRKKKIITSSALANALDLWAISTSCA